MKIKSDFVTNSSTTSYIVICHEDFCEQDILDIMGIQKGSVFEQLAKSLFDMLHDELVDVKYAWRSGRYSNLSFEEYLKEAFSKEVVEKVKRAEVNGATVLVGSLSGSESYTETFFCCDSFEWENDKLYINALECGW